jgi:hypothetical protein
MPRYVVRHTKAELIALLEEKCPEALKKFPKPEAFPFESRADGMYLPIGRFIDNNQVGEEKALVKCDGDMPVLTYKEREQGHIEGGELKLGGVLGDVMSKGRVPVLDIALKIVVAFIFVYCGHKDVFGDLDNGPSVSILVRRLEKLAPNRPVVVRKYPLD